MKFIPPKKIISLVGPYVVAVCLIVTVMSVALLSPYAAAEENQTTEIVAPTKIDPVWGGVGEKASFGLALLKVAGSLAVVIGLMLLLLRGIKKLGIGGGKINTASLINILDTRMIAPKKYVAVLEVADEFVLVGITDQHINLLTKLENTAALNTLEKQKGSGGDNPGIAFASIFNNALNGFRKK